jgi:hypothetical protein
VEAIHWGSSMVDDGADVLEKAEEFTVVTKEDGSLGGKAAQGGDGAKGFVMGNDDGAVQRVDEKPKPDDARACLALELASHFNTDFTGEDAPVSKNAQGAVGADGQEVAVVGVTADGDEAVLAGAKGGAGTKVLLMDGVGVRCSESCFVGVDTLAEHPHDGVGKTLGNVGRRGEAKAEDIFGDPGGHEKAVFGGEPQESGLVPLARVCGELVEEILEVVSELVQRHVEGDGRMTEDGHVVGELGKGGLHFGYPMGKTRSGVQ